MIIESGFLINDDTTYQEIAEYLVKSDPVGVIDLIYILLELKPELSDEIKRWKRS